MSDFDTAAMCEHNSAHDAFVYHEQGSSAIRVGDTWAFVDHRCGELSSVMAREVVTNLPLPKAKEQAA